jgi:WS/DGAT/MGAT family acyltransferase
LKQLNGLDNLYLSLEHGNQHVHISGLDIYDPSSAPGGAVRFKGILSFLAARAARNPLLRRRLVEVPMGLDRPYWVEDAEIDLEYHVRHIALPHPSDWRQLCIQVARIHARPLDFSKPLWEAYVIEGLDNIPGLPKGSFALLTKVHHAAVEGEAGAELLKALHLLSPQGESDAASQPVIVADREPTAVELLARSVSGRTRRAIDGTRLAAKLSLQLLRQVTLSKPSPGGSRWRDMLPGAGARTRFARPLSPHRVVDAIDIPLDRIKAIRQRMPHITTKDICVAIVAGALLRYLGDHDELPQQPLHALVPAALRGGAGDVDSRLYLHTGLMVASMATDVGDPLARLQAIHDSANQQRARADALDAGAWQLLFDVLPTPVATRVMRLAAPMLANAMVSYVRGPEMPLYMAGARLVRHVPIAVPYDNLGLSVCAFGYDGTLTMGFVSCRSMLPDPAQLAQALRESFDEIEGAVRNSAAGAGSPAVAPVAALRRVA